MNNIENTKMLCGTFDSYKYMHIHINARTRLTLLVIRAKWRASTSVCLTLNAYRHTDRHPAQKRQLTNDGRLFVFSMKLAVLRGRRTARSQAVNDSKQTMGNEFEYKLYSFLLYSQIHSRKYELSCVMILRNIFLYLLFLLSLFDWKSSWNACHCINVVRMWNVKSANIECWNFLLP